MIKRVSGSGHFGSPQIRLAKRDDHRTARAPEEISASITATDTNPG